MYSQVISAQTLYSVMTQEEHRNYCFWKEKDEVMADIQRACVDNIYDGTFSFNLVMRDELCVNAHPYGSMAHLCQDLLVRKLSENILHTYRLKPTNRNLIVRQIKQLLSTDTPLCIMRKDVRHFFESVEPRMVLDRLRQDGRVAQQTIALCEMLMQKASEVGVDGTPRGLAVSSALTEFLMHKFDHTFTKLTETLLYNRYVDDIILISTQNCDMNKVQTLVNESLKAVGLEENTKKRYSLTYEDWENGRDFEYLGYAFRYVENGVKVSIATKKLNRIKTRITKSFLDFVKTGDERMLIDRLQFLACISYVKSSALRKVKVGLPANYSAITETESLEEVDAYYQNVLHCKKGSFGHDLQAKLIPAIFDKLKRISFAHSYEKGTRIKFSGSRMHKLKNCWR